MTCPSRHEKRLWQCGRHEVSTTVWSLISFGYTWINNFSRSQLISIIPGITKRWQDLAIQGRCWTYYPDLSWWLIRCRPWNSRRTQWCGSDERNAMCHNGLQLLRLKGASSSRALSPDSRTGEKICEHKKWIQCIPILYHSLVVLVMCCVAKSWKDKHQQTWKLIMYWPTALVFLSLVRWLASLKRFKILKVPSLMTHCWNLLDWCSLNFQMHLHPGGVRATRWRSSQFRGAKHVLYILSASLASF